MKKLAELYAFLINLRLVNCEQIDSMVSNIKTIPDGSLEDDKVLLYRQDYTVHFFIERYPHKKHRIELLIGQISAWLLTHDANRREIQTVSYDTVPLDDGTADLLFNVDFTDENVYCIEDPQGSITLHDKTYSLDFYNLD